MVCYVFLPYFILLAYGWRRVLKIYLSSFLVVGCYGLLQLLLGLIGIYDPFVQQSFGTFYRPNALAYEPSFLALYLTPFVVMANLFYLITPQGDFLCFKCLDFKKILLINLLFLATTATSTIFMYVLFFLFLILLAFSPLFRQTYPHFIKNLLKYIGCCGIFLFCLILSSQALASEFYLKFFYQGFASHQSIFERWAGILNAWHLFKLYPVTGIGLGALPHFFLDAYLSNNEDFIFFFTQKKYDDSSEHLLKLFEPMNVTTELLGSLGICGVIALTFLLFVWFRKGIKAIKKSPLKETRVWAILFIVSTLIMLVTLQINQGLLRTYIWVHFSFGYAFFVETLKPQIEQEL